MLLFYKMNECQIMIISKVYLLAKNSNLRCEYQLSFMDCFGKVLDLSILTGIFQDKNGTTNNRKLLTIRVTLQAEVHSTINSV